MGNNRQDLFLSPIASFRSHVLHTVLNSQLSHGDMSLTNNPNRKQTLSPLSYTNIDCVSSSHTYTLSYCVPFCISTNKRTQLAEFWAEMNPLQPSPFFFIHSSCSSAVQINADGIPWMRRKGKKFSLTCENICAAA